MMEADLADDDPEASFEEELERARELIKSGRSLVGNMFSDVRMGRALETAGALLLVDSASLSLRRAIPGAAGMARLKAKDDYTYLHSFSVCALMIAVGRTLKLPDGEVRELGLAGLVHDIGKLTLPDSLLHKATDRAGRGGADAPPSVGGLPHPQRGAPVLPISRSTSACTTTSAWTGAATRSGWWSTRSACARDRGHLPIPMTR